MSGLMKQEDQGECSQNLHEQQQFLFHQHQLAATSPDMFGSVGGGGGLIFPEPSPWSLPPVDAFNPNNRFSSGSGIDPFLLPPPPYGSFFNRRAAASSLQFAYDHHGHGPSSDHHLRIITDALGSGPGAPFGLQAELGKMSAQEIMDAKALAASKSHSEAERRRRERINNHLAKLRSLLPSTTKTDKASLLAEVIEHVKELKRQTSLIAEMSPIPTEIDELTVDPSDDEEGRFVVKASLCCEDRQDLLPELIKTLKALRLRTLKAEITTLGGRVKNVLFITGEEDSGNNNGSGDHHHHHHHQQQQQQQQQQYLISSVQEALKSVMEKAGGGGGGGGEDTSSASVKRQRTNNINIHEYRSL